MPQATIHKPQSKDTPIYIVFSQDLLMQSRETGNLRVNYKNKILIFSWLVLIADAFFF